MVTSSTLLFHGPGAKQDALQAANSIGRILGEPIGEDGLKIDQAREVVDLLTTTPIGSDVGVVVIGPMDLANKKACDCLLKSLEETNDVVRVILWAHDVDTLPLTIRSRCVEKWCPQGEVGEADEGLQEKGRMAVRVSLKKEFWKLPEALQGTEGKEHELLGVMAEALASEGSQEAMALWSRIREVSSWSNPTQVEILSALL